MLIAVVTTLDTKGAEAAYVAEMLRKQGAETLIVDVGTAGNIPLVADVSREQVAAAAGRSLTELRTCRRDEMMAAMGQGAGSILKGLADAGRLQGVLAMGGNQGTSVAAIALRQLPIGLPKLIVSTVASGNIRPYIGHKDITMMFSVSDILGGPNTVSRSILANAAGAVLGMARCAVPLTAPQGRLVIAITAFGNTDGAVARARQELAARGYEVVVFHASGACGSAMEELIAEGRIHGVLDLTTHELVGDVFGDDIYAPTAGHRLIAAGQTGIPQVIGPGGLDYFCFGGVESIPPKYRGRPTHYHNPYNTNVRTTREEMAELGRVMADRLNASRGRVVVLIPERGWTFVGSPGGPLYNPEANAAFVRALKAGLQPPVELRSLDCTLNDPLYADTAVELMTEFMEEAWQFPRP
jgi:uncharacterized protein (UPF0261 family)